MRIERCDSETTLAVRALDQLHLHVVTYVCILRLLEVGKGSQFE